MDKDALFASTPTLIALRLLLVMSLCRNWTTYCDVSTAFLHALMNETVFLVRLAPMKTAFGD